MGLFEKMGLFERVSEETTAPTTTAEEAVKTEEIKPEVNAEIKSAVNIVDEIYAQNDLSDKSNSIFTVQALINTLPEEMSTATKQSTVSGILAVSGKSVEHLVDDALKRTSALNAACDKINNDRTLEIQNIKADIEELKKAIECANIKIKEAEDIISATNESVHDEVKIINDLIEFCKGMNK